MNPIYEYIAAVFIMTLVVGYSLYSLNTMSSSQLTIAHEEQLQPAAVRLMDKILLTTGYPENWGSNISIVNESNLFDFGLSSQFGEMYRLDVDKVDRLIKNTSFMENPLYLNETLMGSLTGIYNNGGWNYGFRLLIKSALNLNITNTTSPTTFMVDVTNYLERYMGNVEVKAAFYWLYVNMTDGSLNCEENPPIIENVTNWEGRAVIDFGNITLVPSPVINSNWPYAYILIVTANYYGIRSQTIKVIVSSVDALQSLVIGQSVYVHYQNLANSSIPPKRLRQNQTLFQAIEYTSNLQTIYNNIKMSSNATVINYGHYKNYGVWDLEKPLTDDVIFIGYYTYTGPWNNRVYTLHLVSRPEITVAIDYRSHSYPVAGINSETTSRLVRIGDNTYYAELTVWRMSE